MKPLFSYCSTFKQLVSQVIGCFLFALCIVSSVVALTLPDESNWPEHSKEEPILPPRLPPPDEKDPRPTIRYSVEFLGLTSESAKKAIKSSSELLKKKRNLPFSRAELLYRARKDIKKSLTILKAFGYFEARATTSLKMEGKRKAKITLNFQLGDLYTVGDLRIELKRPIFQKEILLKDYKVLPLKIGDRAETEKVIQAEKQFITALSERGYPWARILERTVLLDRSTKKIEVTLRFDPGELALFGPLHLKSLPQVKDEYILNRITWKEGDKFDSRAIDATRRQLIEQRVFSAISITPAPHKTPQGTNPIILKPKVARARHVGLGLSYTTYERLGGRVFWRHENLFRGGEKLGFSYKHTPLLHMAEGEFLLPDFLSPKQSLLNKINSGYEKNKAFIFRGIVFTSRLERELNDSLTGSLGIALERSHIEETEVDRFYTLYGLPLYFKYDTTDDLLNPRKGGITRLQITPYTGRLGTQRFMAVSSLRQTYHFSFGNDKQYLLALWGNISTIRGPKEHFDIPANHRLYAGGPGSVRAYAPYMAGPLDSNFRPIGGRSSVEAGGEIRFPLQDSLGGAVFIEGATVSTHAPLTIKEKKLWGGGVGLRYYSALGPIRFDMAFPFTRRRDNNGKLVDASVQLYISIGQAF